MGHTKKFELDFPNLKFADFTFDSDDGHALSRADAVGGQDGVRAGVTSLDLF